MGPGENGTTHVSSTVTYPTGTELGRDDSELTIQNPYVMMPSPRAQKGSVEKTLVFHSPQKLSDSPEENRVFDNPLYDETGLESRYRPPSTQAAPKKSSTLERAAELSGQREDIQYEAETYLDRESAGCREQWGQCGLRRHCCGGSQQHERRRRLRRGGA